MNTGSSGTVLIFSDDAAHLEKARAALRPRPAFLWSLGAAGPHGSQACIAPAVVMLIFADLSTAGLASMAARLRLQWPGVPALLLTRMTVDNLIHLKDRIWVRTNVARKATQGDLWSVYRLDGSLNARIEVPSNLRIHGIDDRGIIGVWTDSMGIETVRDYAVTLSAN